MSLRFFLDQTCTIKRPTFTNVGGIQDTTVAYSNIATSVPVRVDPAGTSVEDTEVGRVYTEQFTLFFNINADVTHRDRIVIGSDTYEILEVLNLSSLRRYFHKQVVAIKKIDS